MKRNQGFTLIELIIVIVILGILAVTAAPRFLDFSGDARTSTLNGVRGALESAGALVYGRAIIAGVQNDDTVTAANSPVAGVALVNGYPAADVASLRGATELVAAEWNMAVSTANDAPGFGAVGTTSVVISPVGTNLATTEADSCHVVYVQSTGDGIKPVITVYADGC